MENIPIRLFVYGSLRSGFKSTAYEYLSHYFTYSGQGTVKGKFYDNGTYPVAVPTNENKMIVGELYTLNNAEEYEYAFEQLDDYEGVKTMPGQKSLFKREIVNVYQLENTLPAFIYWYNESVLDMPIIETTDLIDYIHVQKSN